MKRRIEYLFCIIAVSAAALQAFQPFPAENDTTRIPEPAVQSVLIPPVQLFPSDSLALIQHSEPEFPFFEPFSMMPPARSGSHWLTKRWVQAGLAALLTGLSGYWVRLEADRSYSSYLEADSPGKMNHYFNRSVSYDKLSSGLFLVCELNAVLSMWFSIREVGSE